MLVDKKKIHETKFEIEEENTKLKIAGRSTFVNPIFFDFLTIGRTIFKNCENFERFHPKKTEESQRQRQIIAG